MTTPDADDASPSPEYSGDPDESDMAAELKDEKHASDGSPSQATSNGQSKSSNAKDPLRPRRKKARRACFACQRAHLTCGDERPCHRCIKRGLQDHCMDGVRKKAKYLHDAPDTALMPGVGGHFHGHNTNHQTGMPGSESAVATLGQQGNFYTQAPSTTYYAQSQAQAHIPVAVQETPPMGPYQQPPISPSFNQTNRTPLSAVPSSVASQIQQFGGPLFDPSDPALFNFDISGLNFGNHYGALELGYIGHMSSGAAETPPTESTAMNSMNQAPNIYTPQIPAGHYSENPTAPNALSFGPDGLPASDWQHAHSRQGSLQTQTLNNTPPTANTEIHGHRNDSLNGPHAYAIGQGTSSLSSASPSSTDVNHGYDTENPMSSASLFANRQQTQQHSPSLHRMNQENRLPNTALQPIQSNAARRRRRDTSWIYDTINKPYNYVSAYHRLLARVASKMSAKSRDQVVKAIARFRPVLMTAHAHAEFHDLVHTEQNLQVLVGHLEETIFPSVGLPSLICRRTGEVLGLSKEFEILTGWRREVLLGQAPNLNVNMGPPRGSPSQSEVSTRNSATPIITGQEAETGLHTVTIVDLFDEKSAVEWLCDLSEMAFSNPLEVKRRRISLIKYRTKDDMAQIEEIKATSMTNGKHSKGEPLVKTEHGIHQGESAIRQLGADNGLVDCMLSWNVRRDTFDMPFLACMSIMPVLDRKI